MSNDETCCGCGATPGGGHGEECDHAHCPGCGGQALMCAMDGLHEGLGWGVWQGEDPIDIAAREFDLFKPFMLPDGPAIVADDFRVRTELAWDPTGQRFVAHTGSDVRSDGPMCVWVTAGGSA